MQTAFWTTSIQGGTRFTLAALMEFVTICAILAGLSAHVGVAAAIFLMLMALALAARRGMLALAMLGAASLAADWSIRSNIDSTYFPQLMVLLIAGSLGMWYRVRRAMATPAAE